MNINGDSEHYSHALQCGNMHLIPSTLHVLVISLAFLHQMLWFLYHIVTQNLCSIIESMCMLVVLHFIVINI